VGDAQQILFDGLPPTDGAAEVMFESPRKVVIENGKFTDWFGPFDVHVYKLKRTGPNPTTKRARE